MFFLYVASSMLVTIIHCSNSLSAIGSILKDGENEHGKCIEFQHNHVTRHFGSSTGEMKTQRQP